MKQANNQAIQQAELAGKTKLTAVSIGHGNHRHQFFAMLHHNSKGQAVLPSAQLDQVLSTTMRGTTINIG